MNYLENSLDLQLPEVLSRMQQRIMDNTTYWGIQTWKNPIDFWVYQEIIHATRPDFIIEIGSHMGGSALALAHMLDHLGNGQVISIDIDQSKTAESAKTHPRITFIEGDAQKTAGKTKEKIPDGAITMVIEDSSHEYDNTLSALRLYSPMVSMGSYFIVEDGICHHGLEVGPNPGPYEAVQTFVSENDCFEIDRSKEDFLISWNPCGYLKRVN